MLDNKESDYKGSKSYDVNLWNINKATSWVLCTKFVESCNDTMWKLGNYILELEAVQGRFTRLINEVGTLPYSHRLEILNLTTLAERI